jgi:uncharacterized protein YndB with AHSA1/START domain
MNSVVTDCEIITSRLVDAPRELVWRMYTEAEHVAQWWGPNGFTNTIHAMDVRPGGAWRLTMHGPDGTDYLNESVYTEVVPPARLVFDHRSGHRFLMTITFEDREGKTLVTMRHTFDSEQVRARVAEKSGAVEGVKQTLDRLAAYTEGLRE